MSRFEGMVVVLQYGSTSAASTLFNINVTCYVMACRVRLAAGSVCVVCIKVSHIFDETLLLVICST